MIKLTVCNLFTLINLALAASFGNLAPAVALTISLDGEPVGGVYNYGITLSSGESIAAGHHLILSNLSNDTDSSNITITGSSIYSVITSDPTGATLQAINTVNGAGNFTPAFSLATTGWLDTGDYLAFSNQGIVPSFSQGNLPLSNSTAVPFEFSPSLGIFSVVGIWTVSHFLRKIRSNAKKAKASFKSL